MQRGIIQLKAQAQAQEGTSGCRFSLCGVEGLTNPIISEEELLKIGAVGQRI
jgi:hypothetical protein